MNGTRSKIKTVKQARLGTALPLPPSSPVARHRISLPNHTHSTTGRGGWRPFLPSLPGIPRHRPLSGSERTTCWRTGSDIEQSKVESRRLEDGARVCVVTRLQCAQFGSIQSICCSNRRNYQDRRGRQVEVHTQIILGSSPLWLRAYGILRPDHGPQGNFDRDPSPACT
jgi:hypothetical protein